MQAPHTPGRTRTATGHRHSAHQADHSRHREEHTPDSTTGNVNTGKTHLRDRAALWSTGHREFRVTEMSHSVPMALITLLCAFIKTKTTQCIN